MVKVNFTRDLDNAKRDRTEYTQLNSTPGTDAQSGEFDWSPSLQGLILGSFFYGYIVTQIPGGYLAERYGGKWIVGFATLVTSLLTLLTPVAARTSVVLLIGIRIIEGLCQGMIFPALHAMLSLWAPKLERTRIVVASYAGVHIGTVLALSLSGFLSSSTFLGGWPSVFYVFGSLGVIWFVPWCFLAYNSPTKHPRISMEEQTYITNSTGHSSHGRKMPWRHVATSMPVWAIIVTHISIHWTHFTMLTELPTYISRILHFDLAQNGILSAVPYIGLFVSVNLSGIVADYVRSQKYISTKTSRKIFVAVGLSVSAALMFSVGYAGDNAPLALALLSLSVVFIGIAGSGFQVNHIDIAPMYAGTLFGISNTIATIPGFVAPVIVGVLTDHSETRGQWQYVFTIGAAINLFGALFYVIFGDGEEQWWAKDHKTDNS